MKVDLLELIKIVHKKKIKMEYTPIRLKKLRPVVFTVGSDELRFGLTSEQQLHQNPRLKHLAKRVGIVK